MLGYVGVGSTGDGLIGWGLVHGMLGFGHNTCVLKMGKIILFNKGNSIKRKGLPYLMINPNLFFFSPGLYPPSPLYAPLFGFPFGQQTHFYSNPCEGGKTEIDKQKAEDPGDQVDELQISFTRSKKYRKEPKAPNPTPNQEEYIPCTCAEKAKKKKVYEKDKERNILPNALSKLFFFIKSRTKSEYLLNQILANNQCLSAYLKASTYYMINSFIKSKMERYKTEKSIELLFTLVDPKFEIFSLKEQLSFIKVNAIMLRIYVKKCLYLESVLSSKRIQADKVMIYMRKYRRILQRSEELLEQAKKSLDFTVLEISQSGQ